MSKPLEKVRAIELRKAGLSYREIRERVPVAKATLSLWLREVGLSTPQKQRLTAKKLAAGRRGAEKIHRERLERVARTVAETEAEARERILSGDMLWLIGTVLNWGEGAKPKPWRASEKVSLTNMDPQVILVAREWLRSYCAISGLDLWYEIFIHESADIGQAVAFWSGRLGISQEEIRIRLKRHKPTKRKNVAAHYYGTMRVTARQSTLLNHRIVGWIRGVVKHCGVV